MTDIHYIYEHSEQPLKFSVVIQAVKERLMEAAFDSSWSIPRFSAR
jgi:hypothetical protein